MVFPAAFGNTIGVASTGDSDELSTFSNWGSDLVTVAAPGENIVSTFPGGRWAVAGLDRNGLRPLRYTITDEGLLFAGSGQIHASAQAPSLEERLGDVGQQRQVTADQVKDVGGAKQRARHEHGRIDAAPGVAPFS